MNSSISCIYILHDGDDRSRNKEQQMKNRFEAEAEKLGRGGEVVVGRECGAQNQTNGAGEFQQFLGWE